MLGTGFTRTVSSTALAKEQKPAKMMPTKASDYELLEEIGQGVSAKARRGAPTRGRCGRARTRRSRHGSPTPPRPYSPAPQVYRALCKPTNEIVAIKVLDLERQDPGKLAR